MLLSQFTSLLLGYKDDCKEPILKNKNLLGLRSTCDEPRLDQNQVQDLRNLLKVTRTCVCLYHVHICICVRQSALSVAMPSIAMKEDSIDDTNCKTVLSEEALLSHHYTALDTRTGSHEAWCRSRRSRKSFDVL